MGLAAGHSIARTNAQRGRSRTSASTAASAKVTPNAKVSRPIQTSQAAAMANQTAPQRALRP